MIAWLLRAVVAGIVLASTGFASGLPAVCPGDCDGSAEVRVDELVRAVGVALGRVSLADCIALDADASGSVTVEELVRAVRSALDGCPAGTRPATLWGVDSNYVALFEEQGRSWSVDGRTVDPIAELRRRGANTFRLRIWVENDPGNREPGTLERHGREMARRAQASGMYVVPTLFMSRGWGADTEQDAPSGWAELPLSQRAETARVWAADAVRALLAEGIVTSTFGIGNETDYGFCGEFRLTDDVDVLRREVWPRAAVLMRATAAGIEEATGRGDLEYVLHVSRGHDPELAVAFFETMRAEGVPVTLAGLSYYPSSWGEERSERFEETVRRIDQELGLPVFLPEYAYPAADTLEGWNAEIQGYPLSEAGQARFVADLRERVYSDSRFAGAVYWTPEEAHLLFGWSAMGLFRPAANGRSPGARAALNALGP